eukprot:4319672-Amphidinium_carterae.1
MSFKRQVDVSGSLSRGMLSCQTHCCKPRVSNWICVLKSLLEWRKWPSAEVNYTVEEATAHVLAFAGRLSVLAADGASMSESILTVPASATYRQRTALLTAGEIAGLPRPQL